MNEPKNGDFITYVDRIQQESLSKLRSHVIETHKEHSRLKSMAFDSGVNTDDLFNNFKNKNIQENRPQSQVKPQARPQANTNGRPKQSYQNPKTQNNNRQTAGNNNGKYRYVKIKNESSMSGKVAFAIIIILFILFKILLY